MYLNVGLLKYAIGELTEINGEYVFGFNLVCQNSTNELLTM